MYIVMFVIQSWAQKVMPNFVWTMPVAVAMSIFGSFNGSVFSGGR